jgi:alcohol dehydrogenase YqhD (iron-dependent ADH family)
MQNFTFYSPTKVLFGRGAEDACASEIRKFDGTRVFIVYGTGSVVKSGLLGKVEKQLDDAGIPHAKLGGVLPNPRLSLAREGVAKAARFGADFILALGGGSVIDTAKGIAHGVANPGTDIWLYWTHKAELTKSLPVGVILTISAAGSETSDSAVLTNDETGSKRGLGSVWNRPKFAMMNPELTFTLPKYQVGCGIVDIMMHTLDRYFTLTEGNETTDEMAEALLRVVIENGRVAMTNPTDYKAMSELMWCGSLSHNGLTGLGAAADFAPHQLGHELSAKFDAAHGASLSAMWGSWALYSYAAKPERFVRYARKVWGIDHGDTQAMVFAGIAKTVEYFKSISMPTCFSELGIGVQDEKGLRELADSCMFHGARKAIGGFKALNQEDVYQVYKLANH